MTKTQRRIVEKQYEGMTRYIVQYKALWIWWDNPCFHVGNNSIHRYDGWGYYDLEGAQACLARCNALDYLGERVVE